MKRSQLFTLTFQTQIVLSTCQRFRRCKIDQRFIRGSVIKIEVTDLIIFRIEMYTNSSYRSPLRISNDFPIAISEKRKTSKISCLHAAVGASQTYGVLDNTFSRSSIVATSAYVNTRLNSYHSADRKWIHSANSGHVLVWFSRFARFYAEYCREMQGKMDS